MFTVRVSVESCICKGSKRVTNVFRMVALDETSYDFYSQINKPSNYSTQLWNIFIFKTILFVILYAPIGAIFVYWMCKLIRAELMDAATCRAINVTRMGKQFVVTHAICPTEIPALLDSWVTNTPSVKMLCPQKIPSPYIFVKHDMFKCWTIKNVSICVLSHKICIFVSWAICFHLTIYSHGSTALVGQDLLIVEASWSNSDWIHSIELLWRGDRASQRPLPDSTNTHTHTHTHTRDRHP